MSESIGILGPKDEASFFTVVNVLEFWFLS